MWAQRLSRQGGAAPAGQTGRAAAGRDVTAVKAAGEGARGGSGHHKTWRTPALQGEAGKDAYCFIQEWGMT